MKKTVAIVVSTIFALSLLSACSSYKCELCHKNKSGDPYIVTSQGVDHKVCGDCYYTAAGFSAVDDAMGGGFAGLFD